MDRPTYTKKPDNNFIAIEYFSLYVNSEKYFLLIGQSIKYIDCLVLIVDVGRKSPAIELLPLICNLAYQNDWNISENCKKRSKIW